jgi:hypothetical protein
METKEIRYIIEVEFDDNGKTIFGKWIKENQYNRKKKLEKIKLKNKKI